MTAEIQRHWGRVIALGCIVTGAKHGITIHHPHGGSMKTRGVHRSFGRKTSDWLVIPLHESIHTGPGGIDGFPRPSVAEWESRFGRQADMVDAVCERLGLDLWALAFAEFKPVPRRVA